MALLKRIAYLLFTALALKLTIAISMPKEGSVDIAHLFARQDSCPGDPTGECTCDSGWVECPITGDGWDDGLDDGVSASSSSFASSTTVSSSTSTTSTTAPTTTPTPPSTTTAAATSTTPSGPSPSEICHERCANPTSISDQGWCIESCGCYLDAAGC